MCTLQSGLSVQSAGEYRGGAFASPVPGYSPQPTAAQAGIMTKKRWVLNPLTPAQKAHKAEIQRERWASHPPTLEQKAAKSIADRDRNTRKREMKAAAAAAVAAVVAAAAAEAGPEQSSTVEVLAVAAVAAADEPHAAQDTKQQVRP